MALRIAMGIVAALRAGLIYGEAGVLASRPLDVPRAQRARDRRRLTHGPSRSGFAVGTGSPGHPSSAGLMRPF